MLVSSHFLNFSTYTSININRHGLKATKLLFHEKFTVNDSLYQVHMYACILKCAWPFTAFVYVVFKRVCLLFSPVTLKVSVLFWL